MPGSNASSDGFDRSPLHAKDLDGDGDAGYEEQPQDGGDGGRDQKASDHVANNPPSQDSNPPAQPNMGPAASQPHTTAG